MAVQSNFIASDASEIRLDDDDVWSELFPFMVMAIAK